MKRTIQAAWLALQENLSSPRLQREPEPTAEMSVPGSVQAFHAQGSDAGALLGIYHFNALQVHALAPEGAIVVDLGCGSGQCLGYMARRRPDLHFVGFDLSSQMVDVGNAALRAEGLAARVELRVGDMTSFFAQVSGRVQVVTSIFSLHHLPTAEHLQACLRDIERLRLEHGAALWVFDHARPRRRVTAERFPTVFTPAARPEFKADSTNSLIASWSFEELRKALTESCGVEVQSFQARILRLYQVHWVPGHSLNVSSDRLWRGAESVPRAMSRDAERLASLFRKLPG